MRKKEKPTETWRNLQTQKQQIFDDSCSWHIIKHQISNVFKTVHLDRELACPDEGRTTNCAMTQDLHPTCRVCCIRPIVGGKNEGWDRQLCRLVGKPQVLVVSFRDDPILRKNLITPTNLIHLIIFTIVIVVGKWRVPFGNHVWIASANSANIKSVNWSSCEAASSCSNLGKGNNPTEPPPARFCFVSSKSVKKQKFTNVELSCCKQGFKKQSRDGGGNFQSESSLESFRFVNGKILSFLIRAINILPYVIGRLIAAIHSPTVMKMIKAFCY
jgi:hypothetical protein